MRFAYVVLAHTLPDQLSRLIRRLHTPDDLFFVHIDRKTPDAQFFPGLGDVMRLPNVHLLDRVDVRWGAFGQLEATLKGVAAAARTRVPYDYLVLLTGRDYPIKPVGEIRAHIEERAGQAFMDFHPLPRPGWGEEGGLERLRYPHLRLFAADRRLPRGVDRCFRWGQLRVPVPRRLPAGLRPYQGSSFWWLPRDCVEYVQQVVDTRPEILRFFRHAFIPEESFFQMVLLSSPHADRVVNDYLRYTAWRPDHWPHGTNLGAADLPKLKESPALFGSKFDRRRDAEILDLIDRELLGVATAS